MSSETLKETEFEKEFSFQRFAENPFFIEHNRQVVKRAKIRPQDIVVDLGCGPGQVTELIKQENPKLIFAVDPDKGELKEAEESVKNTPTTEIKFLLGYAQHLIEVLPYKVDKIIWANGPHLVPDEQKLATFAGIRKVLKPSGQLIITTTFFNEAYIKDGFVGGSRFYGYWLLSAFEILERAELITREQRKLIERKNLISWSKSDYQKALEESGFMPLILESVKVEMTRKGLVDISHYDLFIEGALGEDIVKMVGLKKASLALAEAVTTICQERKIEVIPRNWLVGFAQS